MTKISTVLITGALGHIGSALIRSINAKKVIMIDNLESQRYPSLFDLPDKREYEFIEGDIRDMELDPIISKVDVVIHLAAITNAEASHDRAKEVESVNLDGLKRVADTCLKNKVRLFFPSSTSVYGSQSLVVDEACTELQPQSPYAHSKIAAEKYLQKLGKKGLQFVTARFGTIFGYSIGIRFHTAVQKFSWQAANGQALTVWKTAWQQKRPYLYLGDAVKFLNFIIEKDIFNGEIYNVVTQNFTVEDVVNEIKLYAPNLTVNYVDSPIMNQLSYNVNDNKIKKRGFEYSGKKLSDGIGETFDHLKKIQKN